MLWHPLLLTVLVLDGLSCALVLASSRTAFRIVLGWCPLSSDREQIALEVQAESSAIQIRYGILLFAVSSAILITAIANVLPLVVPGAMCGTGVLQAASGAGERALGLRLIAAVVMWSWWFLQGLNRREPDSPLAVTLSRAVLLLLPVLLLTFLETFRFIAGLDFQHAVDCCTAVYDRARFTSGGYRDTVVPDVLWVWATLAGGVVLVLTGVYLWRFPSQGRGCRIVSFLVAPISLGWTMAAAVALVRVFAAYHYEVLQHHCPWCLFTGRHNVIGYPLFVALLVAGTQGIGCSVAQRLSGTHPGLSLHTTTAIRRAGLRVAITVSLFLLLTCLPALAWKLRFGVWMG